MNLEAMPPEASDLIRRFRRIFGSTEKPRTFLEWHEDNPEVEGVFWPVVQELWSGFDAIDHEGFEDAFDWRMNEWRRGPSVSKLPPEMTIYRGQSGDHVAGLSWSLDRGVAERFAQGHRGIRVPAPVLLTATVWREDVCMAHDDRNEFEVVLWTQPNEICETALTFPT
jgi:hypothetical protein